MSKTNKLTRVAAFACFATPEDGDGGFKEHHNCSPHTGDFVVFGGPPAHYARMDAGTPSDLMPGDRIILRRAAVGAMWRVAGRASCA